MNNTQKLDRNSRIIRKLCWFFIVVGVVEIFISVFILKYVGLGFLAVLILGIIPGLITTLSANITLNKKKERKKGYFGSIWNMLKYNPISLSMFVFILSDFLAASSISIGSYVVILIALLGIISFVCSIILAIKISNHNRILTNL